MTYTQIQLIRLSWTRLLSRTDQLAEQFYGRLFEIDPAIMLLFRDCDMRAQGQKLIAMLDSAVNDLEHLEALLPVVTEMGHRHTEYGVVEQQYDTVGEALIWALAKALGNDFDTETQVAWSDAYGTLAEVMIKASQAATLHN